MSLAQAFAAGIAVAATLIVLELAHLHHAPAAATAVLITTGLARPGPPPYGLICGLAFIIAVSPLLALATRSGSGTGALAGDEPVPGDDGP